MTFFLQEASEDQVEDEELTENTAERNPDASGLSMSEEAVEDKSMSAEFQWSTSGELESGPASSPTGWLFRMIMRSARV